MPAPGTKPKDGPKHGRTAPLVEWLEVERTPYLGPRPQLPASRRFEWVEKSGKREFDREPLREETLAWWEAVSTMPHCRFWSASDWAFAVATALVADMLFAGEGVRAGELRQREKVMGTTFDSRRDLRIRYVDPVDDAPASESPASVTDLASRRGRLTANAS